MRIFIMVRCKINPERIRRELRSIIAQHLIQPAQPAFLPPHRLHQMQELPRIGRVKNFVVRHLLTLRQPEQRFQRIKRQSRLPPEIQRHQHRHVTTEPIHITPLDPKPHHIYHRLPQGAIIVIQIDHILPAVRIEEFSLLGFADNIPDAPASNDDPSPYDWRRYR